MTTHTIYLHPLGVYAVLLLLVAWENPRVRPNDAVVLQNVKFLYLLMAAPQCKGEATRSENSAGALQPCPHPPSNAAANGCTSLPEKP